MLGNGIFNRDGVIWRAHRAMTRPFFGKERVTDLNNFETHTREAMDALDRRASASASSDKGVLFSAQDLASRYTIDTAATFVSSPFPA